MASQTAELQPPASTAVVQHEIRLLVELPSWHKVFFRNLFDMLLWRNLPHGICRYPRAAFWPDVFVERGVAWGRMRQSALGHIFLVVAVYGLTTAWITDQNLHPRVQLHRITNYDISEYLPPLDTGSDPAPKPRIGQPRFAKQKIISLQPNADNHEQTIITPPTVKLPTNLPLPNIVAWNANPSVPTALATRQASEIRLPNLPTEIIAPAPDPFQRDVAKMRIEHDTRVIAPSPEANGLESTRKLDAQTNVIEPAPSADLAKLRNRRRQAPEPAVIEPPPDANLARNLAAMNIGHLNATVAAPKLEIMEQQVRFIPRGGVAGRRRAGSGGGSEPIAAPVNPVTGGGSGGSDAGRLIALNLNPVVPKGPVNVPPGRRSGEFAVGPDGHPNAPGTPEVKGGRSNDGTGTSDTGKGKSRDLPPGLVIGNAPDAPPSGTTVVAGIKKPDVNNEALASTRPLRVGDISRETDKRPSLPDSPKIEERVFGSRRIYTLSLNMPNLVSAGGSWIIRFAEISDDHSGKPLSAPVATSKVDPAYPADLMRNGVEGTVVLYAVIHKDGTVGEVKVLRGVQSRLDENARVALSRWKFRPGTKNGEAVDLEAIVQIPFKVSQIRPF